MKSFCFNKVFPVLLFLLITLSASAQNTLEPVPDEELKGVWVYTRYEAGGKVYENDFHSIKIYGDDGEYCCARAQRLRSGAYRVLPVDYGVYVYRNGEYNECGRKGNLNLFSPTNFNGMYIGRLECWEKVPDFPEELKDYIVEECRKAVLGDEKKYQLLMEKYWIEYGGSAD